MVTLPPRWPRSAGTRVGAVGGGAGGVVAGVAAVGPVPTRRGTARGAPGHRFHCFLVNLTEKQ